MWQEHGLVFTTTVGTPYESHNLRRDFRRVTAAAGLGVRWVPKELRTSFVSMMRYQGVPVEEIARLAGHASSRRYLIGRVVATVAILGSRCIG
ncbi:MAG TPA: tyrosine-type recombinase/integrase [Terracidiphilus sp.]